MKKIILLFACFGLSNNIEAQTITTFAGNGPENEVTGTFAGDGGQATAASLSRPSDICIDGTGCLLIADGHNNRVRKVNTAGIITTIAGTGINGNSGDGGPATAAQLNGPNGVTTDKYGNIYITSITQICKVSIAGIITTIAGTGTVGYSGDGGQATAATLRASTATMDSVGNFLIADAGNHCIRKVTASGIISTIAGTGIQGFSGDGAPASAAQLYGPGSIAFDKAGNMFIVDGLNLRIRKIDTAGIITTIAGNGTNMVGGNGGPASVATLSNTVTIALDGADNIYMTESNGNIVRRIDHTSGIITKVAGDGVTVCGFAGDGGPASAAQLCGPAGLAIDVTGRVYFTDVKNHRVRRLSSTLAVEEVMQGKPTTINVTPNPAISGLLTLNLPTAHNEQMLVTVTDITGKVIKSISAETNKPVAIQLNAPAGIYLLTVRTGSGVWKERVAVQ
ncbi:MAG: T9SS type A sorting domain-containing protein [Taibaiella sp.]|nr:T9SS type A sorting domain-containing protein [Taibaiella sp.]